MKKEREKRTYRDIWLALNLTFLWEKRPRSRRPQNRAKPIHNFRRRTPTETTDFADLESLCLSLSSLSSSLCLTLFPFLYPSHVSFSLSSSRQHSCSLYLSCSVSASSYSDTLVHVDPLVLSFPSVFAQLLTSLHVEF